METLDRHTPSISEFGGIKNLLSVLPHSFSLTSKASVLKLACSSEKNCGFVKIQIAGQHLRVATGPRVPLFL